MQLIKIDNLQNKIINKTSLSCIVSTIQLFALIPLIILMNKTIVSFHDYGWAINIPDQLPNSLNSIRSWFLFFVVFYLALITINIKINISFKHDNTQLKFLLWFAILLPIFSIYLIWLLIKNRYLIIFIKFVFSDTYDAEQINHQDFIKWITRNKRSNRLVRNTLIYYISLVFLTIGFILIFIPSTEPLDDIDSSEQYFIFNIASYFTQQNNILCWLFLILFFGLHRKQPFAKNTLLSYNTSYIFIVGLVANIMIIPYLAFSTKNLTALDYIKFFWLHLINQIFFIWFAINTFSLNKTYKLETAFNYYSNGVIYPIFYGIYLYSLPFIARHSVYGWLTNLNWMMINSEGQEIGSPVMIIGLFALIACFIFTLWMFRRLNKIIIRNSQKFY